MAVVDVPWAEDVAVDAPSVVADRLEAFAAEVLAEAVNRPVQMVNGGLYLRGLLEQGPRKSLEPIVERLGGVADYQSLQQFLAVSSWDPALVVKATAERVASRIDVQAWVLDDTGFPKDGKHSPGVKRQYSGTLGKIGNCQIGVSVHAAGSRGTVPLGWALYLPEEWCGDPERRHKARIPEEVVFRTKPQLAGDLALRAASWEIPTAPVLGDEAYGANTELRDRLHSQGLEYVLSVGPEMTVFTADTEFVAPAPRSGPGRRSVHPRPDRAAVKTSDLIAGLGERCAKTLTFRDGPDGLPRKSRFVFARIHSAHHWRAHDGAGRWDSAAVEHPPREEWLIAEWPKGSERPTDYWISNLPASAKPGRLARLARLRWTIELDYRQLKGQLGLDHYEGRSWLGWYHHTALVTAAHGFLTLERLHLF
ncbi:MAG: IS701 family transposase [Solirubrobacteraceae bacterium]